MRCLTGISCIKGQWAKLHSTSQSSDMAVYERFDFGVDGFVRLVDDQAGVLWEPSGEEGDVGVGVPRLKCSRCGHFDSHSKKDCSAKVQLIYRASAQKSRLKLVCFTS